MNIGRVLNTASFGAKVVRQKNLNFNFETKNQSISYSTKTDVLNSYDKQIAALQKQKAAAGELDEFMHSGEVQELASQLPEGDEIEICSKFYNDAEQGEDLELVHHHILFEHNSGENDKKWNELTKEQQFKLSYIDIQNADGSINKQKIIDSLNNLIQFFR